MKGAIFFKNLNQKLELERKLKELEEKLDSTSIRLRSYQQIKSKLETEKGKLEKARDKSSFSRIKNEIKYLEELIKKEAINKKNERDMIEELKKYQLKEIKEIFNEIESYDVRVHSPSLNGQPVEALSVLYKELSEILPQVKQKKIKEIRISRDGNNLKLSY